MSVLASQRRRQQQQQQEDDVEKEEEETTTKKKCTMCLMQALLMLAIQWLWRVTDDDSLPDIAKILVAEWSSWSTPPGRVMHKTSPIQGSSVCVDKMFPSEIVMEIELLLPNQWCKTTGQRILWWPSCCLKVQLNTAYTVFAIVFT